MRRFEPAPSAEELSFAALDPFRKRPPPPLARRAALELRKRLRHAAFTKTLAVQGKMFGVLVVADEGGTPGYLSAFAGRMGKAWTVDDFCPPVFEERDGDPRWNDAERKRTELDLAIKALRTSDPGDPRIRSMDEERRALSRSMLRLVQTVYLVPSFSGREQTVAEIFGERPTPGGVGECAAPKLLAAAQRRDYRPLAIAEFWVGPPPRARDRDEGTFYPACEAKCGPLLPFIMNGLP